MKSWNTTLRLNSGRKKKSNSNHIDQITEFIAQHKDSHYKILDIKVELDKNPGLCQLSASTIRNIMKRELGMSFK